MGEHLFERLARERNITVEEMRAIISARIEEGWNNPDLEKRKQWRKIPCAGKVPTPDEWLKYAVESLEAEGRRNLLCWYPNLWKDRTEEYFGYETRKIKI